MANLILARMARRERELVIRTAMGAGAGRLLRQLLTESLIMALLAAGVGIGFAVGQHGAADPLRGAVHAARAGDLDGRLGAGLRHRLRGRDHDRLRHAGRRACPRTKWPTVSRSMPATARPALRAGMVRKVLIAAQVAFSYMLLIGAGLMVNSLVRLERVDPGFATQRVFAVSFDLNFTRYPNPASQRTAVRRLLDRDA